MENNKLIAEFMGTEWHKAFFSDVFIISPSNISYKFNSSWDWLMPVVDRIESLRNEDGNAYRFTIDMCNAKIDETNIDIIGGSYKLDSTYKAVVEFINKYS